MKTISFLKLTLLAILAVSFTTITAQTTYDDPEYNESCTSILVGKMASTDGSVMTAHTCDSYYRTWIDIVPAMKHEEGAKHDVYWGTMHSHTQWSKENLVFKGSIPQAKETYAYLNTAYPSLNEKQLAIGETTFGGKKELRNKAGMFQIEELERIVLQRCTTARDAIKLIGKLVKEYGYGDAGECITIADKKEVWQLEIMGEGPDQIGSVWAAQRIPDGHVGVSANRCRISELNLKDKDHFMASENVFEVAKKMKFWDGKETFKFWKAYASKPPFDIREFFVLSTVAPSLNLDREAEELPFSVKPDNKLSVRDVLKLYRETYDGTQYEMIRNLTVDVKKKDENGNEYTETVISPAAHPWMDRDKRNLVNSLKKDVLKRDRPISVQYCAYSFVVQLRDWLPDEIGGRLLFGIDVPRLTPRIPIYSGTMDMPKSYKIDNQDHFSRDAAGWAFRRAARLSTVKWGEGKKVIEPVVAEFEDKIFDESEYVENRAKELYAKDQENAKNGNPTQLCKEFLTQYSSNFARAAEDRWWDLGDELWVKFRWSF